MRSIRQRPLRALWVLAALLSVHGTTLAAQIDEAVPFPTLVGAERSDSWSVADAPDRVTLISDSAIAGIRWSGALGALTNTTWDARLESCRRLVRSSCRGREGYAPRTVVAELQRILAERGQAAPDEVLIVGTGYNDWHSTFLGDFTQVMTRARAAGFTRVAWMTYRDYNSYTAPGNGGIRASYSVMNQVLRAAAASGSWPELVLLNYDTATRDQTSWFTRDGLHLTFSGAYGAARWLSDQVRYRQNPALAPANWLPYSER